MEAKRCAAYFMDRLRLIVKSESANVWWGIYGFCEKTGWEDLNIFNDKDEKIGAFCLNAKRYLRQGVEDLRDDPNEHNFVHAIDKYLEDNRIHYWYYYNDSFDENFFEVAYEAPRNQKGEKPRYLDIWHPDESIDISTIQSATNDFASTFLKLDNVDIQIEEGEGLEESLKSYKEHLKHFGPNGQIEVAFKDDLVNQLSVLWDKSTEETLDKLRRAVK
jgi:hypothetical protein